MDRVACARALLETVSEIAGKTAGVAGTSPTESEAERDLATIVAAAMRKTVELAGNGGARRVPDWGVGVAESRRTLQIASRSGLEKLDGRASCKAPRVH